MNHKIGALGLLFLSSISITSALAQSHYFPPVGGSWRSLVPGSGVTPNQATKDNIRSTVGLEWDDLKSAWDYTQQFASGGSMIVIRDDWIAFEWGNTTSATASASVTKSLLGMASARIFDLSDAGQLGTLISPDSLVADFLPSTWNQDDARRTEVTVRRLLTMSSGIDPWDDPNNSTYTESFILDRAIKSPPGSVWSYSSLSADLASIVFQTAAGASVATILQQDVLGPIGANVSWEQISGSSATKASTGARLSTQHLARTAHLLLHNGEWAGQQLISGQNVALVTHWAAQLQAASFAATPGSPFVVPSTSPQHYGYLFWTNLNSQALGPETPTDAYYARGFGEDLMIVIPSLHMVVVRMGNQPQGNDAVGFGSELMRRVMLAVNNDPPPPGGGTGDFQQAGDGTVSMEAEHFSSKENLANYTWTQISPVDASGGEAMQAPESAQPRMEYQVNFNRTGTHYVYLRSYGSSGSSDSAWIGYDGNWLMQSVTMKPLRSWQWEGPVQINVTSTGVHTVGITRRDSDAQVDKIVILTSANVPTGTGPAESDRGGSGSSNNIPTVDITSPSDNISVTAGDSISFIATADDVEDGNLNASLNWNSSRDGLIGMGAGFSIATLSVGTHTINASVSDSNLASGSDSVTVTVAAQIPGGGTGVFQQAGDGTVSMEAEHFTSKVGSTSYTWTQIVPAGASEAQAMLAPKSQQPRMEYQVNFSRTGTHYVYLRSYGSSSASDSAWIGYDGNWLIQYVTIKPLLSWQWEGPVAINVTSIGVHTVGITRRESDSQADKIVILPTANVPSGTGPVESPR
jgi:CubicO group peptidase (beta-lactamase class C family)